MRSLLLFSIVLLSLATGGFAFFHTSPSAATTRPPSALFGLLEWREATATSSGEVTPLLLLPYQESDILLPGQACRVVLKEGRHFDMVEEALEDHHSIIGQAIMGDDQLAPTLSLCHIVDTDVDSGYRGKITLTVALQSVGRATLEELLRLKPVPLGLCSELIEDWTQQETDELFNLRSQVEAIIGELDELSPNDETSAFRTRYDGALNSLLARQEECTDRERVEASSWALFAALTAMERSFDPRRALESATVRDRLHYGLGRAKEIRATKQRQADRYSLLDEGVFE